MKLNSRIVSFKQAEDSRNHINQGHNLINILLIGIIVVLFEAETWKQMIGFAKLKQLETNVYKDFEHGRIETWICNFITDFKCIENRKINTLLHLKPSE